MRKRVLGVLIGTIAMLLLMSTSAFAETTVDNATYKYGANTNTLRIEAYENSAYNTAMELLEKSDDLVALLSSGYGTKEAPFVINNFQQLRLLVFWMNMSDCDIDFQFMRHSKEIKVSSKWPSLVTSCGKDASDYKFNNVYIKMGSNISETVDAADCSSLFERGISVEKQGEGLFPFLNILNSATVNLDLNGKSINVTLAGSPKACSGLALLSGTKATLNISNGSVTVDSNVKYAETAIKYGIGAYVHHFYIANFRNINAKNLTLKATNTSGTSGFIFKGTVGTVESCNMSYVRNTAKGDFHYEENTKGGALKFRDQITLTDSTFTCTSPNRGGDVRTVESGTVKLERTNLPEGLFAEGTKDVSIERAEIGGHIVIKFIGYGSKIKLDFVNVLNGGEIRVETPSEKCSADVQINNCTAARIKDNDLVETLTINNSTFDAKSRFVGSEIKAKNVTVHGSSFITDSPINGAIDFKRTSSYYNSIRFTDTQMVNKYAKYAISLPALPGYKTAKDEFGDEYVIEYPSTDRNISFRGCSFSVAPGSESMYVYQDPTNLDWRADSSDAAKKFIGLKLVTQKCPTGVISYVNGSGAVATQNISSMTKSFIASSGNLNTSAFLSQNSKILSAADTTLSSIVIDNAGVSKYTLTYNANNKGTFKYDNISQTQYTDGTIKVAYGEKDLTSSSSYYKFKGWAKSPTATTPDYQKGDTIKLESDTVLYAVWVTLQPVKYDLNGGTDKETGVAGSDLLKLETGTIKVNRKEDGKTPIYTPVKEGKYFAGWSTNYNPINVMYEDGSEATIELDEHGNTLVFYAVWADHGKTVRVEIQNKDGDIYTAYTKYVDTSFTMPKACPAPDGKKFIKWYDKTYDKYYNPGDEYVIGEKDAVIVPTFEALSEEEIENTILSVNISDAQTPAEEAVCITDGQLAGGTNYTAEYAGGTSTWWYTDNKGYTVRMSSGDVFKANIFYNVNINVTPVGGNYSFSSDTVFKIAGTTAKVVGVSGKTYTISATFRCDEGNLIRDLNITGFIYPLAGNTVQSEGVTVASANGSSTSTITSKNVIVKWYEGTNTTPLSSTSKFETGKVYHAELTVGSNSMLRKFAKNLTVKVNGSVPAVKEVKVSTNSTTKCEVATFVLENMSVDKTAISECHITGVPDPWAESEAVYPELVCHTDQYTAKVVRWEQKDSNGREREIYATGTYKSFFDTAKAKACVEITPKSGYALSTNPKVVINGKTATFDGSCYLVELDVKKPQAITSLNLTVVPELMEGDTIDFNPQVISDTTGTKVALNTHPIDIMAEEGDITVTPLWTETDNYDCTERVLTAGEVVKKNGWYSLYVEVTHDTGYTWDSDLDFKTTVNCGNCVCWVHNYWDDGNTRIYQLSMYGVADTANCSHSDTKVINKVLAGCTTEGYSGDTICNSCGLTINTGATVAAKGHTVVTDPAVAPTCLEAGKTEGSHCSECGEILDVQMSVGPTGHEYVAATTPATCTTDGEAKVKCKNCTNVFSSIPIPAKGHTEATTWTTDGTHHWHACTVCGDKVTTAAHSGGTATCTTKAKCSVCGAEYGSTLAHSYSSTWKKDAANHWKECTACAAKKDSAAHSLTWIIDKAATTTETGSKHEECTVCGYKKSAVTIEKLPSGHTHSGGSATCKDKAVCEGCGEAYGELAAHSYSEATCTAKAKCEVCGEEYGELAAHSYSEATCTAKAKCAVCGVETGELAAHNLKTTTTKKATMSVNGKTQTKCTVCGEVTKTATVYAAKTVKLSKSKYAYTGKVINPTAVVKNSKGTKLAKGTDYTVSMAKGRIKVGYYTITVKGKGKYSFTKELKLTIKPNPTPIVKVTPGKKSFTVKWKKKTTQVDGYEIQYSTSSGFKTGNKAATIKSNKTTSRVCKSLKAKKTYYVRVRTYKTVNGKKIYSVWSAKKTVTTK